MVIQYWKKRIRNVKSRTENQRFVNRKKKKKLDSDSDITELQQSCKETPKKP